MWVGWNSQRLTDIFPQQQEVYLPKINQSSASMSVVAETLRICKRIANESGQQYIYVPYDLATAR